MSDTVTPGGVSVEYGNGRYYSRSEEMTIAQNLFPRVFIDALYDPNRKITVTDRYDRYFPLQ